MSFLKTIIPFSSHRSAWAFFALLLLYLTVSLLAGGYLTHSQYQQFIDGPLSRHRDLLWQDGAEFGEHPETNALFLLHSQKALQNVQWRNPLQALNECQLAHSDSAPSWLTRRFVLLTVESNRQAWQFRCEIQLLPWLSLALLATIFTMFLWLYQPRGLTRADKAILARIIEQNTLSRTQIKAWKNAFLSFRHAHSEACINVDYLLASLRPIYAKKEGIIENSEWEKAQADKQHSTLAINLNALLEHASRPLTLHFSLQKNRLEISINQLFIPLSATPKIYWLWYAIQRSKNENQGWISNPVANRPNRIYADTLIDLMARYGGHGRAMNDLRQYGLKAKTVDQNRNKIKDALIRELGEELAEVALKMIVKKTVNSSAIV